MRALCDAQPVSGVGTGVWDVGGLVGWARATAVVPACAPGHGGVGGGGGGTMPCAESPRTVEPRAGCPTWRRLLTRP